MWFLTLYVVPQSHSLTQTTHFQYHMWGSKEGLVTWVVVTRICAWSAVMLNYQKFYHKYSFADLEVLSETWLGNSLTLTMRTDWCRYVSAQTNGQGLHWRQRFVLLWFKSPDPPLPCAILEAIRDGIAWVRNETSCILCIVIQQAEYNNFCNDSIICKIRATKFLV